MNYIKQLQRDLHDAHAEIATLRDSLTAIRTYASSSKYHVTEREPMPTMNPNDIVLRVNEALSPV